MKHVRLVELAGRQFNRVAHRQLLALGWTADAVREQVEYGRLVVVEPGVYAVAPVLDDERGVWMGATLTAPRTFLCRVSAGAACGFWDQPRDFETVVRHGTGGPKRHGGLLVFHSETLAGETTMLGPIPITTPERTLLDLAATREVTPALLRRALREALRVKATTLDRVADHIASHRGRRGAARLARTAAQYSGLPVARSRSGAEVRALIVVRDAGLVLPALNVRIAGEEADLSWRGQRAIIEVDGGPFHLDVGEDARKQAIWEAAGWTVLRIAADDVYADPQRLVALATAANVPLRGL